MTHTQPQKNIFAKNKKILLSLFVLLLFFGVGIFVISNGNKNSMDPTDLYKKENPITPNTTQENGLSKEQQEKLDYIESMRAPRQFLLKQLNTNWEGYKKYLGSTINNTGDKIYAAYYSGNVFLGRYEQELNQYFEEYHYYPDNISPEVDDTKLTQYYNHPEDEKWKFRGGVIVFTNDGKKINIIWESRENFSENVGETEFKDIDNDSVEELILKGGYGSRQNPDYYIYKWKNNEFYLINPHPESDNISDRLMLGDGADLRDIDNDKIYEVVTVVEEDKYDPESIKKYIYKFNGSYYYLWKETPAGKN